jgi:ribonuclease HI
MDPPSPGAVKINVDAAVSRGQDHGAVSAVCRDETSKFLGASARTINGLSDPTVLEAMACAESLMLAQDLGATKLIVSSDCLEMINMLKTRNLCRYTAILLGD